MSNVYEVMGDDDAVSELISVEHDEGSAPSVHPESGRPLRPLFGAPGLCFFAAPREHGNVWRELGVATAVRVFFIEHGGRFVRVLADARS